MSTYRPSAVHISPLSPSLSSNPAKEKKTVLRDVQLNEKCKIQTTVTKKYKLFYGFEALMSSGTLATFQGFSYNCFNA